MGKKNKGGKANPKTPRDADDQNANQPPTEEAKNENPPAENSAE